MSATSEGLRWSCRRQFSSARMVGQDKLPDGCRSSTMQILPPDSVLATTPLKPRNSRPFGGWSTLRYGNSSPQRIGPAHRPNEGNGVWRHGLPASLSAAALPFPEEAKTLPTPADGGIGLRPIIQRDPTGCRVFSRRMELLPARGAATATLPGGHFSVNACHV